MRASAFRQMIFRGRIAATSILAILTFASLPVLTSSCATPKTIEGRTVTRTLWINGQIVYVTEQDQTAMRRGAAEAKEAMKGIVFTPLAQNESAQKPAKAGTEAKTPVKTAEKRE